MEWLVSLISDAFHGRVETMWGSLININERVIQADVNGQMPTAIFMVKYLAKNYGLAGDLLIPQSLCVDLIIS